MAGWKEGPFRERYRFSESVTDSTPTCAVRLLLGCPTRAGRGQVITETGASRVRRRARSRWGPNSLRVVPTPIADSVRHRRLAVTVTTTPGEDARSVIKARNKGAGHGHFRPPMASAEKHQIRLIIPRSQVRSLPAPPISPDAGAQVCSGRYVKGAASTKSPDTSPARVGPSSATRRRVGAPDASPRAAASVRVEPSR